MNKYERCYFSIVNRAKERIEPGIYEKHHIIPKCLQGSNDATNIVKLTIREHFICHVLLTKITSGLDRAKMFYALKAFSMNRQVNSQKINSRFVEHYRKAYLNQEWNEHRKQRIKDALSTPERRATKKRVATEALNRPEVKKKISENSKKMWKTRSKIITLDTKAKISESTKLAMAVDGVRERYLAAYKASQDNRTQKIKDAWADPVKRQLRLERRMATINAKKQIVVQTSSL